ncbi:RNA-binding protein [Plasmodium brasilianum]|uniref:RNA-binding protein, putative n=2 Tax=Plasmodium (Plasmodium) TaxID=418103 RepID=A0A1A8W9L8_PLAMA|nr:RNA-binding protein, putative [Plasmodium malariae]KAI4836745.1 RNA-binding protein [Plasmodium brasilianum]SBS88659.1 RNA-binding protein, putative [Plasmodium malariae]SCO94033.1 RNA-binding protein, putative [Plasmodium malariae]
MDSLYGDLPPPVSSNSNSSNKLGKGENTNTSNEGKNTYIEINKFLITPAIVQKKIANIKNVNKEKNLQNSYDNNKDGGNKGFITKGSNYGDDEDAILTCGDKIISKDNSMKSNESIRSDTNIEIININKSIQNDLKKISYRLNKIQQSNKSEQIASSHNIHRGSGHDDNREQSRKDRNEEMNKEYGKFNESNNKMDNLNDDGINNNSKNTYFENGLYEKYFITDANEDYYPNKPNDLNKIIKERKRKKLILLALQRKKLEEEQMEETTKEESNRTTIKEYDKMSKNANYGYADKNCYTTKDHLLNAEKNRKDYVNSTILSQEEQDEENNMQKEYKLKERKRKIIGEEYKTMEDENEQMNIIYTEKLTNKIPHNLYNTNNMEKMIDDSNDDYMNKGKEMVSRKAYGKTYGITYDYPNDKLVDQPNEQPIDKPFDRSNNEVDAPVKKDFATRMMEKMGWKKGEGLGKDKQGIKAPLILQKVDKRSGVIIQAPVILKKNNSNDSINSCDSKTISRIIQLTNLVTVDEVDDTLKEEIEEEASKFGNLLNSNIVIDKNLHDAFAVKIFCEYESSDQAQNALNTFKGRTFAGRRVEASFADEKEYTTNLKVD